MFCNFFPLDERVPSIRYTSMSHGCSPACHDWHGWQHTWMSHARLVSSISFMEALLCLAPLWRIIMQIVIQCITSRPRNKSTGLAPHRHFCERSSAHHHALIVVNSASHQALNHETSRSHRHFCDAPQRTIMQIVIQCITSWRSNMIQWFIVTWSKRNLSPLLN